MISLLFHLRGTLGMLIIRVLYHVFCGRKERKFGHLLSSPISQFASVDIKFPCFVFHWMNPNGSCSLSSLSVNKPTQEQEPNIMGLKQRTVTVCPWPLIRSPRLPTWIEGNFLCTGVFAFAYSFCTYFHAVLHVWIFLNREPPKRQTQTTCICSQHTFLSVFDNNDKHLLNI